MKRASKQQPQRIATSIYFESDAEFSKLKRAAELSRCSMTAFAVEATLARANEIIKQYDGKCPTCGAKHGKKGHRQAA